MAYGSRAYGSRTYGGDEGALIVVLVRTGSDSAPADDSVNQVMKRSRFARDIGRDPVRTLPSLVSHPIRPVFSAFESQPAQDSVAVTVINSRSGADTAPATDSPVNRPPMFYIRAASDSTPATDLATRLGYYWRSLADSTPAVDSVTPTRVFKRSASDNTTLAESAARFLLVKRASNDTAQATDDGTRLNNRYRTGADALASPTDSAVRSAGRFFRTAGDTAPATDAAVREVVLARSGADTAPATDAATRALVSRRSSTDSLTTTDAATRRLSRFRTTADTAPATDAATKVVRWARSAADALTASDVVVRVLGAYRSAFEVLATTDEASQLRLVRKFASDTLAAAQDAGVRKRLAKRSTADATSTADAVTVLVGYLRSAADLLFISDAASRRINLVRRGTEASFNVPEDFVRRRLWLHRATQDDAYASDVARPLWVQVLHEVLPVPTDTATRMVIKARSGLDSVPVLDSIRRLVALWRKGLDTAPATDTSILSERHAKRNAFDLAGAADAVTRVGKTFRRSHDSAPALDVALRKKGAYRSAFDLAPALDSAALQALHARATQDALEVLGDLATFRALRSREARDRVPLPIDHGWWLQTHRVDFGPPVATLTHVSKVKVGAEPGCDTVDIAFTFDQPVTAWTVRINSTGPYDGTEAADWVSEDRGLGFGLQTFGTSPFGRKELLPDTTGTATLYARDLLHGDNQVVVYGKSGDGLWSFHPTGSLSASV